MDSDYRYALTGITFSLILFIMVAFSLHNQSQRKQCVMAAQLILVTDMSINSKVKPTITDMVEYTKAKTKVKSPQCSKYWSLE